MNGHSSSFHLQLLQIVLLLTFIYVSFDGMYYFSNQEKKLFPFGKMEMAKRDVLQKGSGARVLVWLLYSLVLQLRANQ